MGQSFDRLVGHAWSLLGRPWALPPLAVVVVVFLQVGGSERAPLAVFFDEARSRELLGLLWQVEAAAIALVLAASLFAFESLTRQRSNIPLVEYANRSRLSQFLMLAASGLLVIPVVLFATPGLPSPTAAFAAAVVGLAGLVALPFFIVRAMRVVHPSWLRDERLTDIQRTTQALVDRDAFERAALLELRTWADERSVEVLHRMVVDGDRVTEQAGTNGVVLDLDLDRLEVAAEAVPNELVVATRLVEAVWNGAALIGRTTTTGPIHRRRAVTISTSPPPDDMDELVRDLHEEGLESVRLGSPSAAEQVATMYAEVWLAWPRAWARYGQQLRGGLMGGLEPFRMRPTDELKRNVFTTIQLAVDNGLRDHVHSLHGILWKVGFESVRLGATDLIAEMNALARWTLLTDSRDHPKLAAVATENAWRFQVELCEYAARPLDDDPVDIEAARDAAGQVRQCFSSLVESLRSLFDAGKYEVFRGLDLRFRKMLAHWDPARHEPLADLISEDPVRFGVDADRARRAHMVLELEKIRSELETLRRAGRLSILGWMLRRGGDAQMSEDAIRLARESAGSLGTIDELIEATGSALDDSHETLSKWIMLDRPELEVGIVDSEGPVLTAVAMSLLSRPSVDTIPAASWINDHRASRLHEIVSDVADWEYLWGRLGETPAGVHERAANVQSLLSTAQTEQTDKDQQELAARPLDEAKVRAFQSAVVSGWRDHRVLPDLVARSGLRLRNVLTGDWAGPRFGFAPHLDPKGLFVSPTNWVGLEDNGKERGRQLAQGEVSAVLGLLAEHAVNIEVDGDAPQRLRALLENLRADGQEPSLVVLPIDWRLSQSLGLEEGRTYRYEGGLGRSLKGLFEGIPVIDWWDLPKDRIFAVDIARFCEAEEGVEEDGTPTQPEVTVEPIDEELADEITSHWDALDDPSAEHERKVRVLTSVRTSILRPYRVELRETGAARFVSIPQSERDDG